MFIIRSLVLIFIVCHSFALQGMDLQAYQFNKGDFDEAYNELVGDNDPEIKGIYYKVAQYLVSGEREDFDDAVLQRFIKEKSAVEELSFLATENDTSHRVRVEYVVEDGRLVAVVYPADMDEM